MNENLLSPLRPSTARFSRFAIRLVVLPAASNDANAPPSLYPEIQGPIRLKLGPAKAPDDVIVIDHAEKPSEN
jgi:uncharacterized protein (TIGR03435 family)